MVNKGDGNHWARNHDKIIQGWRGSHVAEHNKRQETILGGLNPREHIHRMGSHVRNNMMGFLPRAEIRCFICVRLGLSGMGNA